MARATQYSHAKVKCLNIVMLVTQTEEMGDILGSASKPICKDF